MKRKNKVVFCLHPETGLVNKQIITFSYLKKMNKTKFNLTFKNNLYYRRGKHGIKVVSALSLFRKMIKKISLNTSEIPNGDFSKHVCGESYRRDLSQRYRCGDLLKPESEWEHLGNHEAWDKIPHETRFVENSMFQGKQQTSNDPKERVRKFPEDRIHEQCKKQQ